MHYKWWQNAITKHVHRKLRRKIICLGLRLWRVHLRINLLGLGVLGLRLKLCLLVLGDYILDCEGILRGLGFHRWLSLLTHSSPF